MSKQFDVVVIGAGPVGLVTALLLARCGVTTLVLERDNFEPLHERRIVGRGRDHRGVVGRALGQLARERQQRPQRALAVDPESWIAHYNYGFYFARKGETEAAFLHLDRDVALLDRSGHVGREAVIEDLRQNPVLESLRRDPRFERLLG